MEKQTKNIINRRQIADELVRETNASFFPCAVTGALALMIFIPMIIVGLSSTSPLFNNVLLDRMITITVFVPIPGVMIALFVHLCIIRSRLSRGEFEITTETLLYKDHNPGRRRGDPHNVLYFNNFERYGVSENHYLLAASGDKYYLVHFKNSRRILRAYPTKSYELK